MREIYTAQLERKLLLSASAECYHLEFTFVGSAPEKLEAGQFLSLLADDPGGKNYTRAYSIASAPPEHGPARTFDLCVNRVPGGFFSNLLCDMREGEAIRCHGPHGLFTLQAPPVDGLLVAAGTGIAPIRGFAQSLFAQPGRGAGREYWLVYEAQRRDELFYDSYFQELADGHAGFHYVPVLGGDGRHEPLEREIARIFEVEQRAALRIEKQEPTAAPDQAFDRYAYVCGLSEMVKTARAQLLASGWQKRQVLFERYD